MAGIRRNRRCKAFVGIIMTMVMVLSLFAGVGAIWVNEKVGEVSAAGTPVADSSGVYSVPENEPAAALGTKDNPFMVLEIVPNHNLAQFGYLVGGQEPVDLVKVNNADFQNGTHYYEALSTWIDKVDCEEPLYREFEDVAAALSAFKRSGGSTEFTYSGENYSKTDYRWVYADQTYYPGDFYSDDSTLNQKLQGEGAVFDSINDPYWKTSDEKITQYGIYVRDAAGDFKLVYLTTTNGYEYVRESDAAGEAAVDISGLTDEKINLINMDQLKSLLGSGVNIVANESGVHILAGSGDFIFAPNGDLYVYVGEGRGSYSSSVYKPAGAYSGEWSTRYKEQAGGDYVFDPSLAGEDRWKHVPDGTGDYAEVTEIEPGVKLPEYVGTHGSGPSSIYLGEYLSYAGVEEYYTYKGVDAADIPKGVNRSGSEAALPVVVDETTLVGGTGLAYIGSKDYEKYIVNPMHMFAVESLAAGDETDPDIIRYRWEGRNYEDCISMSDTDQASYRDYMSKNNLLLVDKGTYDGSLKAQSEAGTGAFSNIKARRDDRTVYEAYVKVLKNKEIFKTQSLGLGYVGSDIRNDYETTGYKFLGWFKDKYGVNPFNITSEGVVSDVTLYAKWLPEFAGRERRDYVYTITFSGNKGLDVPADAEVKNLPADLTDIYGGGYICQPENIPILDGKIFTGWYLDADCLLAFNYGETVEKNAEGKPVIVDENSKTLTLYAGWKDLDDVKVKSSEPDPEPARFSIKFDSNITSLGRQKRNYKIVETSMPGTISDLAINGWVAKKQPEPELEDDGRIKRDAEGNIIYKKDSEGKPIYQVDGAG
ncbi:MAG: InlB B-repeat-containing protein, partial [Lachnospiraceae bacterium]|nr:InlB B-repeat-containing protein [Lachnospiraceae bacterium]